MFTPAGRRYTRTAYGFMAFIGDLGGFYGAIMPFFMMLVNVY